MRFRKSISICKGVKLNLSKSGPSLTVGRKGISFNVGGKGAFVNWSIPGTGVYDRVRVDTKLKGLLGGLFGKKDEEEEAVAQEAAAQEQAVQEQGVQEAAAAQAVQADIVEIGEEGAVQIPGLSQQEAEEITAEMELINIGQQAADVARNAGGDIDPAKAEADIEEWLTDAEAPIPFAVQAEILPEKKTVMVDLDLPEIEDMPSRKVVQMANGTFKIKDKTKKEQREDYRTCVFGLGEYVASNVLGLVPGAEQVVVSAYTQRRDEKTGENMDVYIYSVVFAREKFMKDYQERDPYDFCGDLRSRFYVLSTGVMKEIAPFEAEEL